MAELVGGDIVRLKHDPDDDDLQTGDCGIVWGVYDLQPVTYEATFCNHQEQYVDLMFTEDEVQLLTDVEETPFPKHLQKMQQILAEANEAIRKNSGPTDPGVVSLQNAVAFAQGVLNRV